MTIIIWKPLKCLFALALLFSWRHLPGQAIARSVSRVQHGYQPLDRPSVDTIPADNDKRQFVVGTISITGNHRTKPYIISRELPFKTGDSISMSELVEGFARGKEHLNNTRLFNEVVVYLKGFRGFAADVQVDVKERWYIFPLPYVQPVDRNFTTWAEKNYSLSRLNYGLRFAFYNFTGRNDLLRIWLITGYTKQVEFAYDQPYADRTLRHGFGFGFSYAGLKEVNALTQNNQQYFIDSDTIPYAGRFLRDQMTFSLRYYFRPEIKTKHFVRLSFNHVSIDSAVTVWNPHYFNQNRTQVFYPELAYVVNYNDIDYVPYPLRGYYLEAGILHRGINADMNLWQLNVKSAAAWQIWPKTYVVTQNYGTLKWPLTQPFYNQQLLGYGELYLRGLEKYVVDGVAGALTRNTLLRELYHFSIPFLQGTAHDRIPFRIYAKVYGDAGYVYNQDVLSNSLVNRPLYTGGAGVDIVTLYDFVFRFEYSFNQLGEKGFFFHIKNDF